MRKFTLLAFFLTIVLGAQSQQEPMVSQYMFNGLFLNPAYAGNHPFYRAHVLHRNQWVEFEGSPQSSIVTFDGPVASEKMGLGLMLAHDQIGVTKQTEFFGNYSYHLRMPEGKLSFGLKGGFSAYSANTAALRVWDEGDAVFVQDAHAEVLIPKFGFGMFYFTDWYYAGLSIPTLMAHQPGKSFSPDMHRNTFFERHYYFTTGYVFEAGTQVKLKPSFLFKYQPQAPLQVDVNFNALLMNKVNLGFSWRTGDAVVGMLEYFITNKLRLGYAYDHTTTMIGKFSAGSHEIMIAYDFVREEPVKIKTPRFF